MSTHNIGFYEEINKNYPLIIIKYHQIRTLSLPLDCHSTVMHYSTVQKEFIQKVFWSSTLLLLEITVCFLWLSLTVTIIIRGTDVY